MKESRPRLTSPSRGRNCLKPPDQQSFFIVILSPAEAGRKDLDRFNIIANPAEILRRVQKSNAPQDDKFGVFIGALETRPTILFSLAGKEDRGSHIVPQDARGLAFTLYIRITTTPAMTSKPPMICCGVRRSPSTK